jgi:molybdopterin-guanine dinucleotide biosynthesis protein A
MGTDKALLEVADRPLVRVAVDAFWAAGAAEVMTVGGDLVGLAALGLDARPDHHPDEGPLGGLITALRLASNDLVGVLACDMPAVAGPVVRALVDALDGAPEADGAVAVIDGRLQAITAVYRRQVLGPLEAAFASGERAVRRAIGALEIVGVEGLDADALADVDRPDDLRRYAQPP